MIVSWIGRVCIVVVVIMASLAALSTCYQNRIKFGLCKDVILDGKKNCYFIKMMPLDGYDFNRRNL